MEERIVITGIGVYSPIGKNVQEMNCSISASRHGFKKVDEFDVTGLRNDTAGIIKDIEKVPTLNGMRSNILLKHAVQEAIQDAGLFSFEGLDRNRVGVSLGTSLGGYSGLVDLLIDQHGGEERNGEPVTSNFNPHNTLSDDDIVWNMPPILLSYEIAQEYGLSGFIASSVTACSASANAFAMAKDYMNANDLDAAIVGGVDPITQLTYLGFNALMALTKGELKVMDKNRSGLLIGEGAGCMILEKESIAKSRGAKIYGVFSGYGISNDAYHPTQPHPEAVGGIIAIERALQDANIEPKDIDYVNVHGTGTKHNDLMEIKALHQIFGERLSQLPISSSKSMIGHTLGAAGAIEAVISVLAIYKNELPPNLNFEDQIEGFDYCVVRESQPDIALNNVLSNSFGFGGNCASLIFSRYEPLAN